MDPINSSEFVASSRRLNILARQLCLHKPPPPQPTTDEQRIERSSKSSSPAKPMERFRPKRAAVLICLFEGDDGDLRVILTQRASRLSTHPGQVSLPGGKAEEGDADDAETAVREAKEEIGLDPSLVTVLTSLHPFLSKHLLSVTPVIAILPNRKAFAPILNPDEVEAVFDAPLEMFLKDDNWRSKENEWMGEKFLMHYFDYEYQGKNHVIYGLTAAVLIRAASVVYQKPPVFPEKNPQFKFPRIVNKDTMILG